MRFLVVVVGDRPIISRAAVAALSSLTERSDRRLQLDQAVSQPAAPPRAVGSIDPATTNVALPQVVERARRYLDATLPTCILQLFRVDSPADIATVIAAGTGGEPARLALLVIDHQDYRKPVISAPTADEELAKLASSLPDRIDFAPSPATVQVYTEPDSVAVLSVEPFTRRWLPSQEWVITADLICSLTDSIQGHQLERFTGRTGTGSVVSALTDFLDEQAGSNWGVHSYTGSVVSRFIADLERHACEHGNPVLRGPTEHSLACSALARWQLYRAPFVITVTSGMVDEFRGTLADLRLDRAQGFIICADSRPDDWYPFQGTIHQAEDSRAVMLARGLPVVNLLERSELPAGLAEAFAAYRQGTGPVVLYLSREVLEELGPVALPPAATLSPPPATSAASIADTTGFGELVELINRAPKRLLCQTGPISERAAELAYRLAERAGIGLVDSLAYPGVVARYHGQRSVPNYLGTLSLYGYSARVYEFLHRDGRLRPGAEQGMIFLGGRITGVDTPFSARVLKQLSPHQIVECAADRAPFTTGPVGPIERILQGLLDRLDVAPDVLELRRAAIAASTDSFSDVVGLIPVRPMTPNYFFRQLHGLLDRLIVEDGYRYLGVYDVGRAALSAVCNLPRTGPGYSGWSGRALMGDALSALPALIHDQERNVLTFVGDGAAGLVADIVPTLVQQVVVDRLPLRANVSIFRLVNGAHSVIRTYREALQPDAVGVQTGVLSVTRNDWQQHFDGLTVTHRRIEAVDEAELGRLGSRLTSGGGLDLYTVLLGHNNEGDGLSSLAALGWQRDQLSPRLLTMAAREKAQRR